MVACLWIRSLPLACELAEHPGLAGAPAAVVGGAGMVEAVSAAAEAHGVHPGQSAREAIGRCPALAVIEARPARYRAAWDAVVAAVERAAFSFEPAAPGTVHVAFDELLTVHGSPDGVVAALLRCAPRALEPRLGVGPTRFSALLAARRAPGGAAEVVAEQGLAGAQPANARRQELGLTLAPGPPTASRSHAGSGTGASAAAPPASGGRGRRLCTPASGPSPRCIHTPGATSTNRAGSDRSTTTNSAVPMTGLDWNAVPRRRAASLAMSARLIGRPGSSTASTVSRTRSS